MLCTHSIRLSNLIPFPSPVTRVSNDMATWMAARMRAGRPRKWDSIIDVANRYSRTLLIRTLVIRMVNYPDRLGPSGKFVKNSTKLTCLEISLYYDARSKKHQKIEVTGYRIKYSTMLWFLELQIRRGRKVKTQVHTVNSNSRNSHCQCSIFSKKILIIRNFCISGWLVAPINPA